MMHSRILSLLFWSVIVGTVAGQNAWEYTQPYGDLNARSRDLLEMPDGSYVIATMASGYTSGVPSQFHLSRLSVHGSLLQSERVWDPRASTTVSVLQHMPTGSIRAYGTTQDLDSAEGFYYFDSNLDLEHLDSGMFVYQDLDGLIMDNVIVHPDGGALILGSAREQGGLPVWTHGIFLHIGPTGEQVQERRVMSTSGILILRDGFLDEDGSYWIGHVGNPSDFNGAVSHASVAHLASDLSLISTFISPNIHGWPTFVNPADQIISDQLRLRKLGSGDFLMSGRVGDLFATWSAVLRMSDTGELLDVVVFDSDYSHDQVGVLSATCNAPEGEFYFAITENMHNWPLYAPTSPSKVRVLRLDTTLNVRCEMLVDGFATDTYYLVDRIVSTADGGFVLVGGSKRMNDPGGFKAWARKFPPEACSTAMDKPISKVTDLVHPNPGSEGFTWRGVGVHSGSLRLFDGAGRLVKVVPVENGSAHVQVPELGTGVYQYVVLDGRGDRSYSGRWVKQAVH